MSSENSLPDRLKAGSPGLGEASVTEIEQRAAELAQIDGRESFTDADFARAATELAGSTETPVAPEAVVPAIEELTAWDDPVDQAGHRTDRTPLENESNIAERLVQEGFAEADHDRRVTAADEAKK